MHVEAVDSTQKARSVEHSGTSSGLSRIKLELCILWPDVFTVY